MSSKVTVQGSPPPQEQEILAMHIDGNVNLFREGMKKFMQSFLCADDQPAPRKWKLCELLLVGFMRNLVAPSCFDESTAEDLNFWQAKCEAPVTSLCRSFIR